MLKSATKIRTVTAVGLITLAFSLFYPVDMAKFEAQSPTMYDQNGELIHIERNQFDCWMLQAQTIDPQFKELLLSFEDRAFYLHPGVNPFSLARALWQAVIAGKVISGGSTLTMQVARLLNPGKRTVWRKLIEIHTALRLTSQFSKETILKIYLTLAPYGGNISGIRAASLYYFGKEPNALPLSYQAMLVAIPQAPSNLRPDRFIAKANIAKNKVLQRLSSYKDWFNWTPFYNGEPGGESRQTMVIKEALSEVCTIKTTQFIKLAPHGFIAQLHGKIKPNCLDKAHQMAITGFICDFVQKLPTPMNAAAIVYSLKTKQILVYIGSAGGTNRMAGNDMALAKRSPGSLLKPFIYGLAMERGHLNPNTIVTDKPINLKGYQPENFDMQFSGELTVEEALQQSLNTPVIQVLNQIGPGYFFDWLKQHPIAMQFPKNHQKRPGLAVGLGGLGISLHDLVLLYSLLANGKLLSLPAQTWVSHTLAQTTMPDLSCQNPGIAYKTGTSYGFRDAWSIGYDNNHVVGIWVGRADGTPCIGYHGRQIAAPLMMQIFNYLGVTPITCRTSNETLNQHFNQQLRFQSLEKSEFKITMPKAKTTVCAPENGEVYLQTNGNDSTLWYVNGIYLGESKAGEGAYCWKPSNAGFYQITAVNGNNMVANCQVQITWEPFTDSRE